MIDALNSNLGESLIQNRLLRSLDSEMATLLKIILILTTFSGPIDAAISSDGIKCPEGWLLKLASCYRWGTNPMTFYQARAQCESWGSRLRVIKNEEENQLFSVSTSGEYFWLGITKDNRNSQWSFVENGVKKEITYNPGISAEAKKLCLLWHSSNTNWVSDKCSRNARLFICQQNPECISGRFGTNCTEECHCRGPLCNSTTGMCTGGCQLGWTGESCSHEKLRPEAKFYCFKIRKQNTLMLRVNQRGTRYRTVTAYNKDGIESPGCNKTHFNHFEIGGMATLKVTQKNGVFQPSCGENQISDDIVSWKIKFQEFPMTSSAYDILFEVECDFQTADTLTRLVTSNSEKSSNITTTLTETKVSVSLNVIDPFSDQPLTTVKLGQQVKLQLKLNNGDDFGVTVISPYNCSVSTLDGVHRVIFKDENGCTPEDSQVVFNSTILTKWQSELFEAFTFQGYDKINFQCQFHVCFSEEINFCRDTCMHSKKRRYQKLQKLRRSKKISQRDDADTGLGTTVSIEGR